MTNIQSVQPPVGPTPIEAAGSIAPSNATVEPVGISDVVEISQVSKLAAKIQEIPPVRTELVERVKAEIAAGTYETPERIELAIARLMDELFPDL